MVEVSLLSSKLVGLMGARQLLHCYGFFFLAGCWTRLVGPSLSTMSASVGEAEAALLAGHARLAAHAEEVALVGGGGSRNILPWRSVLDSTMNGVRCSTAPLPAGDEAARVQ